jgi:regulator of RNase E activity RraA
VNMEAVLTPEMVRALRLVDTPTICNALELAMGGRSAQGFTYGTVVAAPKPLEPMLGYARTARIRAISPDGRSASEARQARLDYYRYVSGRDGVATVVVMQDLDDRPGTGSFWGEVNSAVHQGLGVAGVVTNGSVRDLGDLSEGFPILAGSVGPSHAFVHLVDIGTPVSVFGLEIQHGDLLHADRHGAVRIEARYLSELVHCVRLTQRKEAPLLAAARGGNFSIEVLERAMMAADDIH